MSFESIDRSDFILPIRLLIIDSDCSYASELAFVLREKGFNAIHVSTSAEGKERTLHLRPACVILDSHLERDGVTENGIDTLAWLRKEIPEARILIHSRYLDMRKVVVPATRMGAVHCLTKPSPPDIIAGYLTSDSFHLTEKDEIDIPKVDAVVDEHIVWGIHKAGGVASAARLLSMHRRTLQRKLDQEERAQNVKPEAGNYREAQRSYAHRINALHFPALHH